MAKMARDSIAKVLFPDDAAKQRAVRIDQSIAKGQGDRGSGETVSVHAGSICLKFPHVDDGEKLAAAVRYVESQKELFLLDHVEINVSSLEDVFVHVGHDAEKYARELLQNRGELPPDQPEELIPIPARGQGEGVGAHAQAQAMVPLGVGGAMNPMMVPGGVPAGEFMPIPPEENEDQKDAANVDQIERSWGIQLLTLVGYRFTGMIRQPSESLALTLGPLLGVMLFLFKFTMFKEGVKGVMVMGKNVAKMTMLGTEFGLGELSEQFGPSRLASFAYQHHMWKPTGSQGREIVFNLEHPHPMHVETMVFIFGFLEAYIEAFFFGFFLFTGVWLSLLGTQIPGGMLTRWQNEKSNGFHHHLLVNGCSNSVYTASFIIWYFLAIIPIAVLFTVSVMALPMVFSFKNFWSGELYLLLTIVAWIFAFRAWWLEHNYLSTASKGWVKTFMKIGLFLFGLVLIALPSFLFIINWGEDANFIEHKKEPSANFKGWIKTEVAPCGAGLTLDEYPKTELEN
jgi:hypothetical protein